uniref:Factor of DNA methylation 1-5/IDN2 domain-containing protein n=1 Tax=Fagus sylvatica TaxID=28930 RepID=A0A2N9F3A5_FAGSY
MLKLERELASKQKLQLEIEQLRGQLKVMECMGGENDKAVKKKMEEMEEELKEKVDCKEIIDEEDEELNKLRKEWGEEVYMAVVTALKELNDMGAIQKKAL